MEASIVSANYRKNKSEIPWLMRLESQPVKMAVEQKSIIASKVIFKKSSMEDMTFGCSTVAECSTAKAGNESTSYPPDAVRLSFRRGAFENAEGNLVTGCEKLFLLPDRSMWATNPVYM